MEAVASVLHTMERPTAPVASPPPNPLLRGRLHQITFLLTIPAGLALVVAGRTTSGRVAAAIYGVSLAGLYGASAAYHVLPWSPRWRRWMKRLDHSMIFVLIAGSYTPLGLLVIHGPLSIVTLSLVWGGAAVGVALKLIRIDGLQVVTGILYLSLGWVAVLAAPQLVRGLSQVALGLLLAGAVLYTIGAIVLNRKQPNPSPRFFGYHEVWHSMVIGAGACHYALVLLVLLSIH
jgi:hemolysin III